MKKYIALIILLLLFGCGGAGGGSSDGGGGLEAGKWMIVNVESNTQAAVKNTYIGDIAGDGTTTPLLVANVIGGPIVEAITPAVEVDILFNTVALGTYPVNSLNSVRYTPTGSASYLSQSGTVTLTAVGDKGQPITGSFDTIISNNTDTKRVWGSFSINRFQ